MYIYIYTSIDIYIYDLVIAKIALVKWGNVFMNNVNIHEWWCKH